MYTIEDLKKYAKNKNGLCLSEEYKTNDTQNIYKNMLLNLTVNVYRKFLQILKLNIILSVKINILLI